MKKVVVVALVLAVGLSFGVIAYAASTGNYGPGAGNQIDTNALQNFQKETLPLRDQIIAKRTEIRTEYAKEKPDLNRIATLQKEIIDLRTKIQSAAQKQGLPAWGNGYGPGMNGRGCNRGYGPGAMMGQGYGPCRGDGYGRGDCPMR
ncbi:MAG TPA: hypothetical protein VHO84_06665 [Syntrophorhabdaceae bacterium]|nr:hypothetical protein [Syntrophorhabdaceae bacterium]